MPRNTELAYDEDVEWRVERSSDLGRDRQPPSRDPEDHG
jgi:hypothetical protein